MAGARAGAEAGGGSWELTPPHVGCLKDLLSPRIMGGICPKIF